VPTEAKKSHDRDGCGFLNTIRQHLGRYPAMEISDLLKLLYQNEFGAEHLISDTEVSQRYLRDELDRLQSTSANGDETADGEEAPDHELSASDDVEEIGNGLSRVYLRMLLRGDLTLQTLNRIFLLTANRSLGSIASFDAKGAALIRLCAEGSLPFDAADLVQALAEHRQAGYPALRHSDTYRRIYAPAYRVVAREFSNLILLLGHIDNLLAEKNRVTIAIEGPCASGKTTLGVLLQRIYQGNLISSDAFFLRPKQRTPQRLAEPGGNIDYERFAAEVIRPLELGEPFAYRPFDCTSLTMQDPISVDPGKLTVVEGVYSMHPVLHATYDLSIFLEIDPLQQESRLGKRSPELLPRFQQEWIPMENRYFESFAIRQGCDLILSQEANESSASAGGFTYQWNDHALAELAF